MRRESPYAVYGQQATTHLQGRIDELTRQGIAVMDEYFRVTRG